jgi:hypothetical protein
VVILQVFISCGAEVEAFRDLANRVLTMLEESFVYGLQIPVVIRTWDYRREPPEVVPEGQFAARSLRMVESAPVVVGILGATIPTVTSEELMHAIGQVASGRADNVLMFVSAGSRGPAHATFLDEITANTQMEVVFQEFDGNDDFVLKLVRALNPYVIRKAILERQTEVAAPLGGAA